MKKLIVGPAALAIAAAIVLFTSLSSAEVAQAEPGKPKEPLPTYTPQAKGSPIDKKTDRATSLPQMPASAQAPSKVEAQGGLEAAGTYFLLANPKYPNVTLRSSEPISLSLVSEGEMMAIQLASATGAVQTEVTIAGLRPNTTYHKYEDNYHNHVAFTTDALGEYRFVQDLSRPHFVFIQPRSSTIFLGNSGWSSPVGIWYPITRTGVLTQDIGETLQIDSANITLDGNGHSITGSGTGYGVYIDGLFAVTVTNVTAKNFDSGIAVMSSNDVVLSGNRATSNGDGIVLVVSNGISLTNNIMSGNLRNFNILGKTPTDFDNYIDTSNLVDGKPLYYVKNVANQTYGPSTNAGAVYIVNGDSITVTGLTLANNGSGVFLWNTVDSRVDNVRASNNNNGIFLSSSSRIILTNNVASSNSTGINIASSYDSNLAGNVADSNQTGISIGFSAGISMTGNTMSGNATNFDVVGQSTPQYDHNVDTSNLVDGKPIYYVKNASNQTYGASTNAGTVYVINSDNITVTGLTLSKNGNGVFLLNTSNSSIKNVQASNNDTGISLILSNNITLTNNTASSNGSYGIYLNSSSGSALTGNTANSNDFGIWLLASGGSTLKGNVMSGNAYNFGVNGSMAFHFDNTVDTTNLVDGKPIYYVKNASNQTYGPSTNAGTVFIIDSDNITVTGLTLTKNAYGVFFWNTPNARIQNVQASNNQVGINLILANDARLASNAANSNASGIVLLASDRGALTGNTANSNDGIGIGLSDSRDSILTSNTASSNGTGIQVASSQGVTLTGNTANSNSQGILLGNSSGVVLKGNSMSGNTYNFDVQGSEGSHFDNDVDTTNLVDGKPIYYIKNASNQTYDASTNAGTIYLINSDNITVTGLTLTKNNAGALLWNTRDSRIENVLASGNYEGIAVLSSNNNTVASNAVISNGYGIFLDSSNGNTLTGNTANSNPNVGILLQSSPGNTVAGNTTNSNHWGVVLDTSDGSVVRGNAASSNAYGIYLASSDGVTITGNTSQFNGYGIYLIESSNDTIYNNNFITNAVQAYAIGGSNTFNLPKPIGGNFWSNWTSPDSKNQGFVDFPYVFTGGQDNLPWVKENGWIGWYGEYFANMSLSGYPVLTRTDTSIDFDWGTGSPSPLVPTQEFSVRWTRTMTFTEGMYRFHTISDDGIRLWVDGVLVIDDWSKHSARQDTGDIFLTAGQHNLRVEYFEWIVYATAKVWWESLPTPPNQTCAQIPTVPITSLAIARRTADAFWLGEYFTNMTLSGTPALVRNDANVDFDWGTGSPDPIIPVNEFSVRWTRTVSLANGTYRFHTISDDGICLWVDGILAINDWSKHSARERTAYVPLSAGNHDIKVEYFEWIVYAVAKAWWEVAN